MDNFQTALSAADGLTRDDPALLVDSGKPLVDLELAEIGRAMKHANAVLAQAQRAVRLLEAEQARRIEEIRKARDVQRADAGFAWFFKNPAPKPNKQQRDVLNIFAMCADRGTADMLDQSYALCEMTLANITSWRNEHGESVDVAYERRKKELANDEATA